MRSFWNDLRHGARALASNPGFAAMAILTLALGIGANTAMFSLVNGVLLKPLAYREPGQLVAVSEVIPEMSHIAPVLPVSADHFLKWRNQCKSFEGLSALGALTMNLTGAGEPARLGAVRVSANLFSVLGIRPERGRTFLEEEDHPGHDHVVVLSDSLWRGRFHADESLVGRKILLDGSRYEVIGVLPARFPFPRGNALHPLVSLPQRTDIWKPMAFSSDEIQPLGDFDFISIGRLRRGITPAQALAEMNVVQAAIAKSLPEKMHLGASVTPLQDEMTGQTRPMLLILLSAVGAVLLIVCVNLANLLLVRATRRQRDAAIRLALGASRARLALAVFGETLIVALAGGLGGVALAAAAVQLVRTTAAMAIPRLEEVNVDGTVLLFALGVSVLTALLCGLLPARQTARRDPQEVLRAGSHTITEGRRSARLRNILVGVEVGMSVVLLIGAGLLVRSFVRLMSVDKGFDVEHIVSLSVGLPETKYQRSADRNAFFERLLGGVRQLPGVTSAGLISALPLAGEAGTNLITFEGANPPLLQRPLADFRFVSDDYFRTLGIPLRRGRSFNEHDKDREVVIISERTAQRLWPGADPLGRRFRLGDETRPLLEVVGVVGDVRAQDLQKQPMLQAYELYRVRGSANMSLVVRTGMDPRALAPVLRSEIWKLDPEVPVPEIHTMSQVVGESVARRKFQTTLALGFAISALLLASLGIYGVVAYSVAQRRSEIGIRVALGATSADVWRLVFRHGLMPVAAGLVSGIAGALALGRVLQGLMFGIAATDPVTFGTVIVVVAAIAIAACFVPALRAGRVDPIVALRYE